MVNTQPPVALTMLIPLRPNIMSAQSAVSRVMSEPRDLRPELHKILNRKFEVKPEWTKNKTALRRREFRNKLIIDLVATISTAYKAELISKIEGLKKQHRHNIQMCECAGKDEHGWNNAIDSVISIINKEAE